MYDLKMDKNGLEYLSKLAILELAQVW